MGVGTAALPVFLACFCGCLSQSVFQSKISITRGVGKTARFRCNINTDDFRNTLVHWYRDVRSLGLHRILYVQANSKAVWDKGSTDRFVAENLEKDKASVLDIRDIEKGDAGVYYCAIWDTATSGTWRKIFGGGTRLFVTNRGIKPPKMHLLPPDREEEKNDKFFVACLMTDFFPEVIKVNWEVTGRTDLKILTEPVQEKNGNYSLISRLEVSRVEWEEQTVTCLMTHEALTDKLTTSAQRRADQKITPNLGEVTCPSEESRETRNEETPYTSLWVATLTYTALLTKSVLYCFFISIVVYKMESRGAKKPM